MTIDMLPIWWGTLALINSAIAQSKRRNAASWLLYSLFIGPVATGILVILQPKESTEEALERQAKLEKAGSNILVILVITLLGVMIGIFFTLKLMR